MRAYHIFTGPDGHSHIKSGSISDGVLVKTDHALFSEYPANYSRADWHNAPTKQYVITLSGILTFITRTGETCTIYPGDILLATDTTGTGHHWDVINGDPWRRIYIVYNEGEDTHFIPDTE